MLPIILSPPHGERESRYSGGYTTRTYGSHRRTGIDVIQLEFGSTLRARANLERTAADVAHAILAFSGAYLPLTPREPAQPGESRNLSSR